MLTEFENTGNCPFERETRFLESVSTQIRHLIEKADGFYEELQKLKQTGKRNEEIGQMKLKIDVETQGVSDQKGTPTQIDFEQFIQKELPGLAQNEATEENSFPKKRKYFEVRSVVEFSQRKLKPSNGFSKKRLGKENPKKITRERSKEIFLETGKTFKEISFEIKRRRRRRSRKNKEQREEAGDNSTKNKSDRIVPESLHDGPVPFENMQDASRGLRQESQHQTTNGSSFGVPDPGFQSKVEANSRNEIPQSRNEGKGLSEYISLFDADLLPFSLSQPFQGNKESECNGRLENKSTPSRPKESPFGNFSRPLTAEKRQIPELILLDENSDDEIGEIDLKNRGKSLMNKKTSQENFQMNHLKRVQCTAINKNNHFNSSFLPEGAQGKSRIASQTPNQLGAKFTSAQNPISGQDIKNNKRNLNDLISTSHFAGSSFPQNFANETQSPLQTPKIGPTSFFSSLKASAKASQEQVLKSMNHSSSTLVPKSPSGTKTHLQKRKNGDEIIDLLQI